MGCNHYRVQVFSEEKDEWVTIEHYNNNPDAQQHAIAEREEFSGEKVRVKKVKAKRMRTNETSNS